MPAIDCRSLKDVDSFTPFAFGLLVALWKALEMLHLRRPLVVGGDAGVANSSSSLPPLLDAVLVADMAGACRPCGSAVSVADAVVRGSAARGVCDGADETLATAGRYVSQSFGSGGTGGMLSLRATSSLLCRRS